MWGLAQQIKRQGQTGVLAACAAKHIGARQLRGAPARREPLPGERTGCPPVAGNEGLSDAWEQETELKEHLDRVSEPHPENLAVEETGLVRVS